jgi:hypothetical protein
MSVGLDYIRKAIEKEGNDALVEVIRWEKDITTGYYSKPFKVVIKADIALRELSLPLNKRSSVWKRIRPLGVGMDGNISSPQASNRLNNPELIQQLKAELRAEFAAELAAELKAEMQAEFESEKSSKRKKKSEVTPEEIITPESNTDLSTL